MMEGGIGTDNDVAVAAHVRGQAVDWPLSPFIGVADVPPRIVERPVTNAAAAAQNVNTD